MEHELKPQGAQLSLIKTNCNLKVNSAEQSGNYDRYNLDPELRGALYCSPAFLC